MGSVLERMHSIHSSRALQPGVSSQLSTHHRFPGISLLLSQIAFSSSHYLICPTLAEGRLVPLALLFQQILPPFLGSECCPAPAPFQPGAGLQPWECSAALGGRGQQ